MLDLCSSEARHYDTAGGTRNTPAARQLLQRLMPALRRAPVDLSCSADVSTKNSRLIF